MGVTERTAWRWHSVGLALPNPDGLMRVREWAAASGITERQARAWLDKGAVPAVRVGHVVWVAAPAETPAAPEGPPSPERTRRDEPRDLVGPSEPLRGGAHRHSQIPNQS